MSNLALPNGQQVVQKISQIRYSDPAAPFCHTVLEGGDPRFPQIHYAYGLTKLEWMAGMVAAADSAAPALSVVRAADLILAECERVQNEKHAKNEVLQQQPTG